MIAPLSHAELCALPVFLGKRQYRVDDFFTVEGFGGDVVMTRHDHASGTDRVAEVARGLDVDVVINVQGDEPEVDPACLDLLPELLVEPEGLETETAPGTKVQLSPSDDPLLSLFRSDAAVTPDSFHEELRKQRASSRNSL